MSWKSEQKFCHGEMIAVYTCFTVTGMRRRIIITCRKLCKIRCKNVVTFCAAFIYLHLVLIIFMTWFGSSHRKDSRKPKANYTEDEHNGNNMYKPTTRKILQSNINDNDKLGILPNVCNTGHIGGLQPVCSQNECLRKLHRTKDVQQEIFIPRLQPIPPESMQTIDFIEEYLAEFHIYMLSLLSDLQWHYGIYGSIGELGASEGKLASVFTFNINLEAGEKLFVSGPFTDENQLRTFIENMRYWSFFTAKISSNQQIELMTEVTEHIGNRIVHMHKESPVQLGKSLLTSWNIPQFRMVSVNPSGNAASMIFQSLEKAACILRDGGFIILDGVNELQGESNSLSLPALRYFFQKHGVTSLKPLISGLGKIYLCTVSWYDTYLEYIKFQKLFTNEYMYIWKLVTTAFYGPKLTYFQVVRC